MEGAARLFAGEFNRSTLMVAGEDPQSPGWIVTPGGAWCRQVFLAGALTEVHEAGDLVTARVADPTGGFDLSCGSSTAPAAEQLRQIPRPAFVTVSGRAQAYKKNGGLSLSIRPEQVRVIDRAVRDQWVIRTAQAMLARLEQARLVMTGAAADDRLLAAIRHYSLTPALLDELAALAAEAVTGVRPADAGPASSAEPQDVRALVIDLLKSRPGPRGVAVQEIIDALAAGGVFQDAVLPAIEALIVEDECYQPQKGFIRLL